MMNDSFDGNQGFSIDGGIKDATSVFTVFVTLFRRWLFSSHIRRLTAKHNSPMPAIDVAHQNLLTARAHFRRMQQQGHSPYDELDWSGLIAGTRVAAGLYPFDQRKVI